MNIIITYNDAVKNGERTYFTGKECSKGHRSHRYVVNRVCVECAKIYQGPYMERYRSSVIGRREANDTYLRWAKKNKAMHNAKGTRYRAARLRALPSWETTERDRIKFIYETARFALMHVDHIVPLRSEHVCGLHCIANLRIISGTENVRKSNKFYV